MIKAFVNGKWDQIPADHLQVGSFSFAFEPGLFETFRTIDHKPVFLNLHLDRLYLSAQKIDLDIQFSKFEIFEIVQTVVNSFSDSNQLLRILAVPNNIIVYTVPLAIDETIYHGVKAITVNAKRSSPAIKSTKYRTCLSAWEKARELDCFEAILTDSMNDVFEGSRSNIFWVKDGKIFTRQFDILPGITREIIISKSLYPVSFGQLNVANLESIDELFITNSVSGVVPISQVNSSIIRNSKVGEITKKILNDYTKWILNGNENENLILV